MKIFKHFSKLFILGSLALGLTITSCSDDDGPDNQNNTAERPYVFSLGVTADGTTTYYVLDTDNIMSGTISAAGVGIEQSGYHDYKKFNSTIFSIGGLGVTGVKGVTRDANGELQESGSFVFDNNISEIVQVDNNTVVAIESPARPTAGNMIKLYVVNISSLAITKTATIPVSNIVTQSSGADVIWPIATGIGYSSGKILLSYYETNNTQSSATQWTDQGQIAVISYPALELNGILTDSRIGPIGSWATHNGILADEEDNLYIMSHSSMATSFTQATKPASFTRIAKGTSTFDSYYFDVSNVTGGLRPTHAKYIGNGLVLAEICTNNSAARWSDKPLKTCIINLNNKTVTDVAGVPEHDGQGGRYYMAVVDGSYVYTAIPTSDGIYIYKINPTAATAEKGAKVSTTFVAGFFRLD